MAQFYSSRATSIDDPSFKSNHKPIKIYSVKFTQNEICIVVDAVSGAVSYVEELYPNCIRENLEESKLILRNGRNLLLLIYNRGFEKLKRQ